MADVFEPCETEWRGLGVIASSGLKLRRGFEDHDAGKAFPVVVDSLEEDRDCICGDILRGIKTPFDCLLFAAACTPDNPLGACMVSNEGACNTYFKYR